jgi:hypothetical protein
LRTDLRDHRVCRLARNGDAPVKAHEPPR